MVAVLPRGAIIIIVVTKSDRWKISAGMTLHAEAREAIIQSERFDGQNAWRCREFCLKRNVIANAASPLNQELVAVGLSQRPRGSGRAFLYLSLR